MKYEKITKLAGVLKKIFTVLVVMDVFVLISLFYVMLNSIMGTKVNLGAAKHFSEIYQKVITPTDAKLMIASGCLIVVITLFLFINIRKLLKCIEKNATPFQREVVKQLRKIILWWIVASVIPIWKLWDTFDVITMGQNLFFALIIYLLSLIFEYGISLQTEVDEIL